MPSSRTRLSSAAAKVAVSLLAVRIFTELKFATVEQVFNRDLARAIDVGEALIHGVDPISQPLAFFMPLYTVLSTLLFSHSESALWPVWTALPGAATAVLLFVMGCLSGSWFWGAAALALGCVCPWLWSSQSVYHHAYFSVIVLISAGMLVWRARKPSIGTSVLLGLALGASLLFRSVLVYFPPVWALAEWFFFRRRGLKTRWRLILPVLIIPYVFLVPWVGMNWAVYGRFVPLELDRANNVVIAGALGHVTTIEGDMRVLVEDPPDWGRGGAVLRWAAREVLRHPIRYAGSVAKRFLYVVSLHPLLFLLALSAVWIRRRNRGLQQAGLLALYFLGIHCLVAVQKPYLEPLWPLFVVLAASLVPVPAAGESKQGRTLEYRLSAAWMCCCLAVLMGACLFALSAVISYGIALKRRAPESPEALQHAIASRPEDTWLLARRARRRLDRGEFPGAVGDYAKAMVRWPGLAEYRLGWAWAHWLGGNPVPLLRYEVPHSDSPTEYVIRLQVAKTLVELFAGERERARRYFSQAWTQARFGSGGARRIETDRKLQAIAKLRSTAAPNFVMVFLAEPLSQLPREKRLEAIKGLIRVAPKDDSLLASLHLKQAAIASSLGEWESTRNSLARARGLGLTETQLGWVENLNRKLSEGRLLDRGR